MTQTFTIDALDNIRYIVPDEVDDTSMNCGGRIALDLHLRSIEKRNFDCKDCDARKLCILGLAKIKQ